MDDSLCLSVEKASSHEESGWTSYFEDFLSNQRDHENPCYSTEGGAFGGTSSLVSDAASCVECKVSDEVSPVIGYSPKFSKRLNFKNTRTKEITYDDSLEDTASSPVNSPKVAGLKQMDINQRKKDDLENSLGKEGGSDHHFKRPMVEKNDMFIDGKNNDCTDLRKRGLCLIPLSMLVDYLG